MSPLLFPWQHSTISWLHCTVMTPIFRSPTRVSLLLWFPFRCFRFSLFPSPNSPCFPGNTHNAFCITHPKCNMHPVAAVWIVTACTELLAFSFFGQWNGGTSASSSNGIRRTTAEEWLRAEAFIRTSDDAGWRQSMAIEFFKDIGLPACFGVRCSVIPVVEIWRGPQIPIFLKDFVGDVTRGLLGSGVISLRP